MKAHGKESDNEITKKYANKLTDIYAQLKVNCSGINHFHNSLGRLFENPANNGVQIKTKYVSAHHLAT